MTGVRRKARGLALQVLYEIDAAKNSTVELIVLDENSKQELGKVKKELKNGSNNISIEFSIGQPELWWSNGLGDAHLYKLIFIALRLPYPRYPLFVPKSINPSQYANNRGCRNASNFQGESSYRWVLCSSYQWLADYRGL